MQTPDGAALAEAAGATDALLRIAREALPGEARALALQGLMLIGAVPRAADLIRGASDYYVKVCCPSVRQFVKPSAPTFLPA
jgi:hypothetical protein